MSLPAMLAALVISALVVIGFARFADGAIDYLFPEPAPAQASERIVLCGRVGKYRLYCGVGDDFRGPTEDPVRQWR